MASQKGGGVSFGLLIGLILLFFSNIGTIYLVVSNNSAYHEQLPKVKAAQEEAEAANKKLIEVTKKLQDLNNLVHGSTTDVDIERVSRDYLKVANAKLLEVLAIEPIAGEGFGKDLAKDGKLAPKEYKYLLEMYADLFTEIAAIMPEIGRKHSEKGIALKELETARSSARKEKAEVEAALEKERKEKSEVVAKQLEEAKSYDAEKQRILAEKKQVQDEMAKLQEEQAIQEARLQSQISQLLARIQEDTQKRKRSLEDTEADGEVVHADNRLGIGWVNLGKKHKVRRGTIFDVFQFVKGGVKKHKGQVEVKILDDETAQVAILSQKDPADPIVKGDFIATPFYDQKASQVFVFVGEKLSPRSRYGMEELVRRIEETGGRVDKTVTIHTDFIIAIENAEQSDEFQKAVQFGVTIMREPELLEYLGK